MLDGQHARAQGIWGVVRANRHHALPKDWAFVVVLGHQVNCNTRPLGAAGQDRRVDMRAVHSPAAEGRAGLDPVERRGRDRRHPAQ